MSSRASRSSVQHSPVRLSWSWLPRTAAIAFAGLLGVFALDVFSMPLGPAEKAVALFMHLVPPVLVLLALALVWRREWAGAVLFPALAIAHLFATWGRLDLTAHLVVELPLFLIGGLFLTSWFTRGSHAQRTT